MAGCLIGEYAFNFFSQVTILHVLLIPSKIEFTFEIIIEVSCFMITIFVFTSLVFELNIPRFYIEQGR